MATDGNRVCAALCGLCLSLAASVASDSALADPDPPAESPPVAEAKPGKPPVETPLAEDSGEVIEVTGEWTGQRSEVGRVTLVGEELVSVPGTLGDPVRVVTLLPGVTTGISGLGYPIIRGALPGDSRFEIDGIEIPMLFHFLFAGAVMHPRVVGDLTFEPGAFGAEHGRAIGGRVSAGIHEPTRRLTEVSVSLVDAGAVYADRIGERTTITLGSRAGTVGLLAKAVDPNIKFRYFDYQGRLTHQLSGDSRLTATLLGAADFFDFEEDEPESDDADSLSLGFHRLELRHDFKRGRWRTRTSAQLGRDVFRLGGREDASTNIVRGAASAGFQAATWLELTVGGDTVYKWASGGNTEESFDIEFVDAIRPRRALVAGGYFTATIGAGPLELEPGVRIDHYRYDTILGDFDYLSVDPRLLASYSAADWLKFRAGAGNYHGMSELTIAEGPAVVGPIPASDGLSSQYGLSSSTQFHAGAEVLLPAGFQATLTGYYKRTRHALDYSLLLADDNLNPSDPCTGLNPMSPEMERDQITDVDGKSHGVELLIRRKLGGEVSGWLSATYSRNSRNVPGIGTVRYSYDQPFVANGALLWRPGRWSFGATGHVHLGRPVTPFERRTCQVGMEEIIANTRGRFNSDRLPPFWRVDLRAERTFQFDNWKLSVYLDFFNALLRQEALDIQTDDNGELEYERLRLFLPMLGARGEF